MLLKYLRATQLVMADEQCITDTCNASLEVHYHACDCVDEVFTAAARESRIDVHRKAFLNSATALTAVSAASTGTGANYQRGEFAVQIRCHRNDAQIHCFVSAVLEKLRFRYGYKIVHNYEDFVIIHFTQWKELPCKHYPTPPPLYGAA